MYNSHHHHTEYWQAVQERDTRYDGVFVYAVRSTGIYCRPSCPSRRPHRDQVTFFITPEEADQAGFRPCRRCRPGETDAQIVLVQQACDYLREHFQDAPTLDELATHVSVSPYHLHRIFKRITGVTPRQYTDACRLGHFKASLKNGDSVTRALYDAGFNSSSRVYEGQLGMTPTTYRQGGPDTTIRYAVVACSLGYLLVAATGRGVCAVSLGDTPEDLIARLADEFPAAERVRDDSGLSRWVEDILHYLDGEQHSFDLPLDVQATVFQRRVWEALRAIPYGDTRTYSEIAAAVGQPQAARAVAQACATNPAALVIPCHRVVRKGGDLGGYRWGVDRKRALLAREQAVDGYSYDI